MMMMTTEVNNNGAGVVAMLEVAREVSKQPNRIFTVLFMCIDFEEAENSGRYSTLHPILPLHVHHLLKHVKAS